MKVVGILCVITGALFTAMGVFGRSLGDPQNLDALYVYNATFEQTGLLLVLVGYLYIVVHYTTSG